MYHVRHMPTSGRYAMCLLCYVVSAMCWLRIMNLATDPFNIEELLLVVLYLIVIPMPMYVSSVGT